MEEISRETALVMSMTDSQFLPSISTDDVALQGYKKIPYAEIALMGTGFASLITGIENFVQSGGGQVLYKAMTKDGSPLRLSNLAKDGSGFLGGGIVNGKTTQARFAEVKQTATMMIDPTTLLIAVALATIEKKLDAIQETQKDILAFMQDDKRSQQKGDLLFLTDILNNYKYNWDNTTYRTNMHIKTQDIKQRAEQNVIFYRTQINRTLHKSELIITDKSVGNKLTQLQEGFQDYQLALYLYGFSSYLEVMLLKNFDSGYLDKLSGKVEGYAMEYRELYTECYNFMEESCGSSVQAFLMGGIANISKSMGDAIAKIPVISDSQLDENLISAKGILERTKEDKIKQTMHQFAGSRDNRVLPFVENIKTVNRLYNRPVELLFDQECLYIMQEGSAV